MVWNYESQATWSVLIHSTPFSSARPCYIILYNHILGSKNYHYYLKNHCFNRVSAVKRYSVWMSKPDSPWEENFCTKPFPVVHFWPFFHLKKMSLWNTPNTWTFAHVWETLENGAITTWGSSWNPKIGGHKLPFPQLVSCLSGFQWNQQYQTQTHPWKLTCSFENLHVQFRKYIYIYIFIHVWIFQSTVGGWGKDPKSRSWSNLGVSSVVSFSHPSISLGDLCYRMAREFVAGWISLDACEFKKGAFLGGFIYYGI